MGAPESRTRPALAVPASDSQIRDGFIMADFLTLLLGCGIFGLFLLYVKACERI